MSLIDELENTIVKKKQAKKKETPVDKILKDEEVIKAIRELYKKGYGYKKITSALNEHYKGKLGVVIKESRTEVDNYFDTRTTSEGNLRYLYKVPNRFKESQICKILGIEYSVGKKQTS